MIAQDESSVRKTSPECVYLRPEQNIPDSFNTKFKPISPARVEAGGDQGHREQDNIGNNGFQVQFIKDWEHSLIYSYMFISFEDILERCWLMLLIISPMFFFFVKNKTNKSTMLYFRK